MENRLEKPDNGKEHDGAGQPADRPPDGAGNDSRSVFLTHGLDDRCDDQGSRNRPK